MCFIAVQNTRSTSLQEAAEAALFIQTGTAIVDNQKHPHPTLTRIFRPERRSHIRVTGFNIDAVAVNKVWRWCR
ncbi:hypothetical protein E2C01_034263 [Portunus trituberculatus]|uniref:Uncharacterized protein n=1 Tax=Portunus trituberculatus TaxID=210409 RepID=A0A5B7F5A4_PORTR|nr:hypothetical protein [Portunus trituberculatus]